MSRIIRNIAAIIAGVIIGGIVNMGIVKFGGSIIPPPDGADVTTMEGLAASMHLFEPKHFVMPFLAHAVGTFVGALVAGLIAASHKMKFALGVGAFFLLGGIIMVVMVPSPAWFAVLDLVVAYIPMGYIAGKLVTKK